MTKRNFNKEADQVRDNLLKEDLLKVVLKEDEVQVKKGLGVQLHDGRAPAIDFVYWMAYDLYDCLFDFPLSERMRKKIAAWEDGPIIFHIDDMMSLYDEYLYQEFFVFDDPKTRPNVIEFLEEVDIIPNAQTPKDLRPYFPAVFKGRSVKFNVSRQEMLDRIETNQILRDGGTP